MTVKICPECKFANKSASETCTQCGFEFQPDTAYDAAPVPDDQDKFKVPFIEERPPTCEHCGVETTRRRNYLVEKRHYCTVGCEYRDLAPRILTAGIGLELGIIVHRLFRGYSALNSVLISVRIVNITLITVGIIGILLSKLAPRTKIEKERPKVKATQSAYINCPNCHRVVMNNPRCDQCGAKLQ